jgi:hypothetical protein
LEYASEIPPRLPFSKGGEIFFPFVKGGLMGFDGIFKKLKYH